MRLGCVFIFLLIIGCSDKKENAYVQAQEIRLAQPRVTATNTIIDSTVVVTANLGLEGVQIFYTDNGTVPTQKSSLYQKPLKVKEQGGYTFKAFHNDWKPSEAISIKLYQKGIINNQIDWHTKAHPSYPDEDFLSLINQKKGSLNFRDVEWTGFDSIAKASISFQKKTYIKGVTIGYLIDTKSWIFPPKEVTLYFTQKDSIVIRIPELPEGDLKKIDDVYIPIGKEISSITITVNNIKKLPEWHPGKGNKAWLFMDEWIFN